MKFKILKEEVIFDNFFTIKKARIEHETFNSEAIQVERLCFERGDSVAVLIYEKDTDSLLFTNQFRYPATKEENGWILELTAGSIKSDEDPREGAIREVEEEIGYEVADLVFINSFFVSPGGTSERIMLYYSEVDSSKKVATGGGVISENEDIQLVKLKTAEVIDRLKNNNFRDAKTIIGLQWFLLNKRG
jgi:ADP-ribose pyrophosphatase